MSDLHSGDDEPRGGPRRTIPVGGQRNAAGEAVPVVNIYDAVGGQPFFDELVERFYRRVALDMVLRPLYPDDLSDPKRHLALSLIHI